MNTQEEQASFDPRNTEEFLILLVAIDECMSKQWPKPTDAAFRKQLKLVADTTDQVNLLAAELLCLAGKDEEEVRAMVRQDFKARGRSLPGGRRVDPSSPGHGGNS